MKPLAVILCAPGTNRDGDLAHALELAGAQTEIVYLSEREEARKAMVKARLVALPGGFSYGDALGAGRLWSLDLRLTVGDELQRIDAAGLPILGICNGFQALVKAGLLPEKKGTLTHNAQGRFECRWATLQPVGEGPWTAGLTELIDCPIAHGEGNFQLSEPGQLDDVAVALRYVEKDGSPALGYPSNPNGSLSDVAGVTNRRGNVLGLMPHPEDYVHDYQHPHYTRGFRGRSGLELLRQGVHYAASL